MVMMMMVMMGWLFHCLSLATLHCSGYVWLYVIIGKLSISGLLCKCNNICMEHAGQLIRLGQLQVSEGLMQWS